MTRARAGSHALCVGELIFFVVTILVTFFIYVLANGAGMAKALKLFTFAATAVGGSALICLPILLFFDLGSYAVLVFFLTLISLPAAITMVDFDQATPRMSLLGVVLINVLAIHFAESSFWITWLLNPFRLDGVFANVSGLWPSYIALMLAVIGPPGDARLRLVLGVWTQLVGLIWLLPVALKSLFEFDTTDWMAYLVSVVACAAAAHVALLAYSLVAAVKGKSLSTTRGSVSATKAIAERVYVTNYHPMLLAGFGALWWFAMEAWQESPILMQNKIPIAYVAAAVLGALLMPERQSKPDDLGAEIADARTFKWRSYRGTVTRFLIGLLLFWVVDVLNQDTAYIFGANSNAIFLFAMSILAGIFVLNGLFAGARIIGEAAGRPVRPSVRRKLWFAALAIVIFWQYANLPRAHPQGGLDGNEQAFSHGRVYLWYASEVGWWHQSGRAVYFEEAGELRRRVCGDARNPVDSFAVVMDGSVECRIGDEVSVVDEHGRPTTGRQVKTPAIRAQAISANAAGCRPVSAPEPTLKCRGTVDAIESERKIPGTQIPSDWDIYAARYFQLDRRTTNLTTCIEIPADVTLPDGTSTDATALVFYRNEPESRPFWLIDRKGSCDRVYVSTDEVYGGLYYEWHPLIAPYHGETKSRLFGPRRRNIRFR